MAKRLCISLTDAQWQALQKLKRKEYDKSYSELIRVLMLKGMDSPKEKKVNALPDNG